MKEKKPPRDTRTAVLFDDLEETTRETKPKRKRPTIREQFETFHRANPQVLAKLIEFAYEARNAGRERIGMRMLFERLRWYVHIETKSDDGFKLNNNYCPHYARYIADGNPDLAHLFETRELRTK